MDSLKMFWQIFSRVAMLLSGRFCIRNFSQSQSSCFIKRLSKIYICTFALMYDKVCVGTQSVNVYREHFISSTPPTSLSSEVRYEKMMEMFGETGHLCRTVEDIEVALKKSLAVTDKPSIINILIDTQSNRKPQTFNWLTESKLWYG